MPTLRNPALVKECTDIATAIGADAHFVPLFERRPPVTQPISKEWEKGGLDGLPSDALTTFKDLAFDVLATGTSPYRPDLDDEGRLLRLLDEELEKTYRRFYEYVYADLPYCWRLLYTDLSLLKFSLRILENAKRPVGAAEEEVAREEGLLDELVAILDKALILAGGAGRERGRRVIEKLLSHLDATPSLKTSLPARFPSARKFNPPMTKPIRVIDGMTMSAFQSYLASAGDFGPEPLVLKSLLMDWPALSSRPWSSPSYLLSRTHGGRRLVPVEVGRSYVDEGWTQELIPFKELLSRIVGTDVPEAAAASTADENREEEKKKTTYLAQHELFSQLPHLQNDILTPDHCFTSPPPHPLDPSKNKPELDLPLVNAWFGPAGTITPLHTDGYHNLLCQVVGAKYLRLYSPHDSEAVCPRVEDEGGVDMSNTSAFDVGVVEGWDEDTEGRDPIELEEFRGLRYWDCVLEEGDVLYIPIGWWHYVRSLSVSFSVSFWWNGDHFAGDGAG